MRSSALSLALGYVALGIVSLVLFAAPLWYAWQVTIQDGRSEILQADAQRLTDVYRRDGGDLSVASSLAPNSCRMRWFAKRSALCATS